jgi:hypothetical protein
MLKEMIELSERPDITLIKIINSQYEKKSFAHYILVNNDDVLPVHKLQEE